MKDYTETNAVPSTGSLLADLTEAGGADVVSRPVMDLTGRERTFHFRILGAREAMRLLDFTDVKGNADPTKVKTARDRFLAAVLTDATGQDSITVEQAAAIKFELAQALERVGIEVNGLQPKSVEQAGNASLATGD